MLISQTLFSQAGVPLNISPVFTLITYSPQNRNMGGKKTAIAIISEKGFNPSYISAPSCRRRHQVPPKNGIVPPNPHRCHVDVVTIGRQHLPGVGFPCRWEDGDDDDDDFECSTRFPGAVGGVEKESNITTTLCSPDSLLRFLHEMETESQLQEK